MKCKVSVRSLDPAQPRDTVHVARGVTRDGREIAFGVEARAAGVLRDALRIGAKPICTVQAWQVVEGSI